ncbi:lymphocyte antigen 6E-like [Eleutherodactylus coqui]|uniref:lymphocyte antigen 6E-like n=1 Tax=Eleutherodactylus coqui TaxID=57060 RepID=UPI003461DD80
MAAYTSLLLVIALCASAVQSLRCYSCLTATKNTNCLTETNCTDGETYCETTVTSSGIDLLSYVTISKWCAVSCTPTASSFAIASTSVSCCKTDLCNYNGSASIRSSCAAIILALGSVLIILKSSVL